jgi:hypothetical protein
MPIVCTYMLLMVLFWISPPSLLRTELYLKAADHPIKGPAAPIARKPTLSFDLGNALTQMPGRYSGVTEHPNSASG